MKKLKVIASICAIGITCSFTSVLATSSGFKTIKVNSGNAVETFRGTKSSNVSEAKATLSAIGDPDTIMFYVYDTNTHAALGTFTVRESSYATGQTSGIVKYSGGVSGRAIKMVARSVTVSIGSFPINVNSDIN